VHIKPSDPTSKITATGSRRILQQRSEKVTASCRKAPEMEAVFRPEICWIFFRWIPVNFLCFPAGNGRKLSEKIWKFSDGGTASTFQRFSVLSCRNRPVIFDLGCYSDTCNESERFFRTNIDTNILSTNDQIIIEYPRQYTFELILTFNVFLLSSINISRNMDRFLIRIDPAFTHAARSIKEDWKYLKKYFLSIINLAFSIANIPLCRQVIYLRFPHC
jgi:hypothetical protein